MYEAFRERDLARLRELLDPQVRWTQAEGHPHAGGTSLTGLDAVVTEVYEPLMDSWTDFREVVERILDAGPDVVVLGRYAGMFDVTRRRLDAQFAHIWTVRQGKVVAFRQYTDTAQFVRVVRDERREG